MKPKEHTPSNMKGFSLLELVVVIGIMGTLIAMAGMKWSSWMAKYNTECDVKTAKLALTYEQISALNCGKAHFIAFLPSSIQSVEDTNGNGVQDGPSVDNVLPPTQFKTSVTSAPGGVMINGKGIILSQAGSPLAAPVTIKFTPDTGAEYDCILIYPSIIRVAVQNGGGSCDPK
jgi:prepilin-type N-terminal cleavage/methylation domain-containing protein